MKNFKKNISMLFAVMTIAVTLCFGVFSAFASETKQVAAPAAVTVVNPFIDNVSNISNVANQDATFSLPTVLDSPLFAAIDAHAEGEGGESLDSANNGDTQFKGIVEFFVKWIKRVGLLVAFVGAVMFALAIKNNDADQKQNGLLTMVAGFVVAALCFAVKMFGITDGI